MKKIYMIFATLIVFGLLVSAGWDSFSGFPNGIWIASDTATATYADGPGDGYFEGDLEVGGTIYSTTERSFELPLVAAFINGVGVMGNDGTTAPGMASVDNVPAIVYASSAESASCSWTFRVPDDYSTSMGFRMLFSSSSSTLPASHSIDWQLWINSDDTGFDLVPISQTAVVPTSANLSASNEVLSFVVDATGLAAISAGDFVTLAIWNDGTSNNTDEIKGIQAYYTAAR